jgi:hypothetical protein
LTCLKCTLLLLVSVKFALLEAVGLVIARRCILRLSFDDIHPNLYFLLLPETTTPEMLMATLAGQLCMSIYEASFHYSVNLFVVPRQI